MCSRDCSTAMCWKWLIFAGSTRLKTTPTPLLRVRVGDLPVGEQLDLLQLLVGGHLAQQAVDLALDAAVGGLSRRLQRGLVRRPRGRHHGARDQHAQYDDRRDDRGSTSPRSHVTLPPDVPPAGPAAPRDPLPEGGRRKPAQERGDGLLDRRVHRGQRWLEVAVGEQAEVHTAVVAEDADGQALMAGFSGTTG